ncbi:MAG: pyridoxal-phosphate dependent enzyme [Gemmatimonadales bacterium]|nr:MAG: pyridoxal-phosphate dependent enzyme [Gemmatimonadales bacterium]
MKRALLELGDPGRLGLATAWTAVREALPRTPLLRDPVFSECLGREVFFKVESLQVTGSFKVRGALARMSGLSASERRAGVVTCSSGNHGRAVAWSARRLGISAVVCVPGWVDPVKLRAIEALGAEARLVGESYDEAEAEAHRLARETDRVLVHPFDDPLVAAGQGTVALEILESLPNAASVLVPLSGGGLVGGMAYTLSASGHPAHVVAVSATHARVMRASLEAGQPVELPEEPTLASALAGGIGLDNRVTFGLVRDLVAEHEEVSEEEIAQAMAYGYRSLGLVLEGGGATALAALLAGRIGDTSRTGPLVVVLSGGNVDIPVLSRVLAGTRSPAPPAPE